MTMLTILLACVAGIAAVVAVLALVALGRSRRGSAREAAALREQLGQQLERLDAVEERLRTPAPQQGARAEHEYVITRLGELDPPRDEAPVPVRLTAPAFADAVLRESVVQTASLAHGLRRALAAETRNRIRFEMRREVRRSRKARKVEVREALREYRARHRSEVTESEGAA
jgi:hypothetical protein